MNKAFLSLLLILAGCVHPPPAATPDSGCAINPSGPPLTSHNPSSEAPPNDDEDDATPDQPQMIDI